MLDIDEAIKQIETDNPTEANIVNNAPKKSIDDAIAGVLTDVLVKYFCNV